MDACLKKDKKVIPAPVKTVKTVMLVEDDEMVAIVAQMMLEKLDFRVLIANSGAEALKLAGKTDVCIDVVLLDMVLPDMDGDEVFSRLTKKCPQLKVIVCSGFADEDAAQKMMDSGACGFIRKPYTRASLSSELNQVMNTV
jgi:CheY-like chemotaxis protein